VIAPAAYNQPTNKGVGAGFGENNLFGENKKLLLYGQVATGDMVEIASPHGTIHAPVVITPGIAPDVVAMPVGQGHERFTRYASGRGSNPIAILAPMTAGESGTLAWAATRVKVTRTGAGNGAGALILFAGGDVEHPHEHR